MFLLSSAWNGKISSTFKKVKFLKIEFWIFYFWKIKFLKIKFWKSNFENRILKIEFWNLNLFNWEVILKCNLLGIDMILKVLAKLYSIVSRTFQVNFNSFSPNLFLYCKQTVCLYVVDIMTILKKTICSFAVYIFLVCLPFSTDLLILNIITILMYN